MQKSQNNSVGGQRAFYGLLQKVGTLGRYQYINLIIVNLCLLLNSRSIYFTPYLFYEDAYVCDSSIANCLDYVCALDSSQRSQYINPQFSSLIARFGDYRCEVFSITDKVKIIIYIGGIVFGVVIGIFISPLTTKRRMIMFCLSLSAISLALTPFLPTLELITVTLFIHFGIQSVVTPILFNYYMETVQQEFRAKSQLIMFIFHSTGIAVNGVLFKQISWQLNILLCCVFPTIIGLILFKFYIKETPFDLLTHYEAEQCLSQLKFIANENKVEFDERKIMREITQIKAQYDQDININHQHSNISVIDLFRYSSIRIITICCCGLFAFLGLQYDGSALFLINYSIDIYLSSIILGGSSVVITIISYGFINKIQRKKIMYFSQVIGCIAGLIMAIFGYCNQSEQCSSTTHIIQAICLFIYRMSCSLYMIVFVIFMNQQFPNQTRVIGVQLTSVFYGTSVVLVPAISSWFTSINLSLGYFFAFTCVVSIILLIPLKETLGIPPEQMIEELKFTHKKIQQ